MAKHEPQPRTDKQINLSVRVILDALYLTNKKESLILMRDDDAKIYLIPSVMSPDSTEDKRRGAMGAIEYQVSDGLPGGRSNSVDFWNFSEAAKFFTLVKENGWLGAHTLFNDDKDRLLEDGFDRENYEDLAFVPSLIAESVCAKQYTGYEMADPSPVHVWRYETARLAMTRSEIVEFSDICDERCRVAYETDARWFKKCLKDTNHGLHKLHVWITHWMVAYLNDPIQFKKQSSNEVTPAC